MSINFFPEVFMRIQLRQHQKQFISLAGAILKESSLKFIQGRQFVLYRDDNWRQFGTLIKRRYWHGSIALGDEIMVIGGFSIDGR